MVSITLTGTDELVAALRKGVKNAPRAVAVGLNVEANDILRESKAEVPFDLGVLHDSGDVEPPRVTRRGVEVTIGYGGAASKYALAVHEMPRSNKFQRPGSGPKYLERPMLAAARGFASRVAKTIRAGIRRGFL